MTQTTATPDLALAPADCAHTVVLHQNVTLPRQLLQEMARDLHRTAVGLTTEGMTYSAGKLAAHARCLEAVAGTAPLPMTEEQMEADVWDRR